ncbi:type I glyceraldehyde-3-phosphate dehydrogenase [Prauserella muralis]|uniref:Type I glyceraldehyde-3-phosphate dehydrogenase n=1 Tax=Prauserella muralis TaxID=588067 RepID=A0A2V4B183_9PSEU|nr:type I glyceraldehyde-3-phosphate dehydrogenase [Prauserella muralis]PXY22325.1 type I glyceraldehyde-3-phosphate dehydrogenase [Prauserella muralis]TWE27976.1 glyceraldehyde 3-phosphate dehydrogenase [Prauserella muralis]
MTVLVGINGFGRIGRDIVRSALARADNPIEVVAVNDVADPRTLAYLLEYDSTYGTLPGPVSVHDQVISVGNHHIHVSNAADPSQLNWAEQDVDVVIEATGRFRTREAASAHLAAGADKVIISAPGKGVDATIVMGVNDDDYDPARHDVISGASCTTNCVAPMVQVLHRAFGVRRGLMTTIHSYTNDQSLLDQPHKDLRRARSAAVNLVPTTTGAARSVGLVLPELSGKLDGISVRVPVEDGSLTDLTVELDTPVTVGQVNRAFADAAAGYLKDVLRYTDAPVVSRDIIGDPASCVFDAGLTKATENVVKVFGWYDNEWGYANRMIDLAALVSR